MTLKIAVIALTVSMAANASWAADVYRCETITIIIGCAAGGGQF